jgi:hypothetical protein
MRFLRQIVFGTAALHAFAGAALALDWKATALTVTAAPFQAEQVAVFEFANHSSKTVTIRELETSCSCLLANSDRKIYAPGTSGKITAKFTIGDRGGLYERTVTVITDESGSPVYLMLRVEVPDVATVTPRSVAWRLNEEPVAKSVDLTSAAGLEIVFSDAQPTSDAYTVRLESIEAGKRYRLQIKPNSTSQPASAAVRIFGREKSGHDVVLSAYASVQ